MSGWLVAALAFFPAFAVAVVFACFGSAMSRLISAQLAAAIGAPLLIILTFVLGQPSFADLPLALVLLTLPGTLLFALFYERWL